MQHLIHKNLVNIFKFYLSKKIKYDTFLSVDNMHKFTNELISETSIRRPSGRRHWALRYYLSDESTSSVC
jgi:hypothetical protein